MEVYNPLRSGGALYRMYETALGREMPPALDEERRIALLRRYRSHAVRLSRSRGIDAPPPTLEEDGRELVQVFRRFLSEVSERTGFAPLAARIPVLFPRVPVSDGRADGEGDQAAIYVSSGKLDALELFAGTVSVCTRLNELAVAALAQIGEPAGTDVIALPWLTLAGDVTPWLSVGELLESDPDAARAAVEIFGPGLTGAPVRRAAFARMALSRCLLQLMMRAIRRGAESGWAAVPRLPESTSPIDRRYLAVLALTFVVFHEIGHIVLCHNEIGYRASPEEIEFTETMRAAFETDDPEERFVDLTGTGTSFEAAADLFALAPFDGELREPMLDAASLWCTAHERAHMVAGERGADLLRMLDDPEAHPSFAVRVWQMNSRLGAGYRPVEVGRLIVAAAEDAAAEYARGPEMPERELWLYRTVLDLARPALADQAWTPPAAAPASAADSPTTATPVTGLEDDAANDLGLLLRSRGEYNAAEAAFRQADERGSAAGAFNLAEVLEAKGDHAEALQALGRADARGHAEAALFLGHLAKYEGALDRAEAAWWRADARGAKGAATELGLLLYKADDARSAEAAWRRGADRGEPESSHNLGLLFEEQGRLEEADAAWTASVSRGNAASEENLTRLRHRLRELDRIMDDLREEMRRGDAGAAFDLAHLLLMGNRPMTEVVPVMETAERLGHPDATYRLGAFLIYFDEPEAAEAALRRAASGDHIRGMAALGNLLHRRGDLHEAVELWRRADALGDPAAATRVGDVLRRTGDLDGALTAYRRADTRGDAEGALELGRLLERRHDLDGARAAYERAEERGESAGAVHLGDLFHRRGDLVAAAEAWRRADLAGDADAAEKLGLLLRGRGDHEAAEAALARARSRRHPEAPSLADQRGVVGDVDL